MVVYIVYLPPKLVSSLGRATVFFQSQYPMHEAKVLALRRFIKYLMKEKEQKANLEKLNQNPHSEILQMSTESSKLRKLILGSSYERSNLPLLNNFSKYPILFHCMVLNDNASEYKYLLLFHQHCQQKFLERAIFTRNCEHLFKGQIIHCIFGKLHQKLRKTDQFSYRMQKMS